MKVWRIADCTQKLAVGREVILDFSDADNCKILSVDGNELLNFGKARNIAESGHKCYLIELPSVTVLLEDTGEEIDFCIANDDDLEFELLFDEEV